LSDQAFTAKTTAAKKRQNQKLLEGFQREIEDSSASDWGEVQGSFVEGVAQKICVLYSTSWRGFLHSLEGDFLGGIFWSQKHKNDMERCTLGTRGAI